MPDVVIRMPRCILVFKQDEIMDMLKQHPDLWATSLKRGKGISRLEKSMERRG